MLAAILEGIEKAIDDLEGRIEDAHARSDMNRLLARAHAAAKLKWRQADARRRHQAGKPLHQKTACSLCNFPAA
jgi:hypothetical protein